MPIEVPHAAASTLRSSCPFRSYPRSTLAVHELRTRIDIPPFVNIPPDLEMAHLHRSATLACIIVLSIAGCTSVNRISEYDFKDKTLAVTAPRSPRPDVFDELPDEPITTDTGEKKKGALSALASLAEIATGVAKAFTAEDARARLDSASMQVDVAGLIVDGIRDKTARYLGATPTDDENAADYVVEIRIERHGIYAGESYTGEMKYILDADVVMLDNLTGREVWKRKMKERIPFTSGSTSSILSNLEGAVALSNVTVDQLVGALEALSDETSTSITRKLSRDIEKARS
ncbi:MAG: hypothetical protein WD275_03050 [Rhodothermales bacterium]